MMISNVRIGILLTAYGLALVNANTIPSVGNVRPSLARNRISVFSTTSFRSSSSILPSDEEDLSVLLSMRGGASRRPRKSKSASLHAPSSSSSNKKTASGKPTVAAAKPSALATTLTKYRAILPVTRIYITAIACMTLLSLVLGEEATQGLLALDPTRTFYGMELWRPFTAAAFLGTPTIGVLMSAYYLFEYGTSLERAFGTAQHVVFVVVQLVLLTALSSLLTQPFFGQSMITAMLHVLSRSMPNQQVKWLIFTVPYWSLPYGLMAGDVLQASSAMAALPHVMGILSGHCYYFHKFVWPKLGGEDWLVPPDFLQHKLDPDSKKDRINAALAKAKKKRKKGRKLGS